MSHELPVGLVDASVKRGRAIGTEHRSRLKSAWVEHHHLDVTQLAGLGEHLQGHWGGLGADQLRVDEDLLGRHQITLSSAR
jgi:hypothetical protein